MWIAEHTPERLVIRDVPSVFQALGWILLSIGAMGLIAAAQKQPLAALHGHGATVAGLLGGLGIALGLAAVWRGPASTFVFDKSAGTFVLRRRTLFGFAVKHGRLPDITEVRFTQSPARRSQDGPSRVSVVLASGERFALSGGTYGGEGKQYAVDTLRRFLSLRPADPLRGPAMRRSFDQIRAPRRA